MSIVDETRRESISQELYRRRKAEVGDSVHIGDGDETEDEDLIGYDAIEPGLPPASSDRQKWWLDNKQPARAHVPIPNGRDGLPMALNPGRPSNPFGHNEEQDWISVSRSSSRASFSSLSSSPYEKVMLPSIMNTAASSTSSRKPVAGHELSNLAPRMGRLGLSGGDYESTTGSPPPPPPRRQTMGRGPETASTPGQGPPHRAGTMPQGLQAPMRPISSASLTSQDTSSTNGRSLPPPVAKKPAHLATGSVTGSITNSGAKPPLPSRASTMGANGNGPPLPSRQANGGSHISQSHRQSGSVDLLGDHGGHDMGGWESLQPSR